MKQKLNCIMLIDDDEPTNFLSRMIIEETRCTEYIQIEDSGEKAVNYLMHSEKYGYNSTQYPWPDLIFLDINMPAMNGWEFLEKYKGFGKKHESNAIIIMLTTSLNPDDKIRANDIACVSGFMHKPLTEEILDKIIQKYFIENKYAARNQQLHFAENLEKINNPLNLPYQRLT